MIALKKTTGVRSPFQVTMQRVGRKLGVTAARADLPLRAFFFDCLYLNGEVLLGAPEQRALASAVHRLFQKPRV